MKPHLRDFFLYLFFIFITFLILAFFLSKPPSSNEDKKISSEISPTIFSKKQYSSPPEMQIDSNKKYSAVIETDLGLIKIELFSKETPIAVNNFVFLAKDGFYDQTFFHRVIKNFMIQGGDPSGTGKGGPGYFFSDEKITRDYKRGIVAMANSGANTNGSQFFIMHKDYNLPKQYVIFGQVIEGMETVDKIAEIEVSDNGLGEKSKPLHPVKIRSIQIIEE